jgi:hypothetical protein
MKTRKISLLNYYYYDNNYVHVNVSTFWHKLSKIIMQTKPILIQISAFLHNERIFLCTITVLFDYHVFYTYFHFFHQPILTKHFVKPNIIWRNPHLSLEPLKSQIYRMIIQPNLNSKFKLHLYTGSTRG